MNLYDVRRELESLVDPETGEIAEIDRFMELNLAREDLIENTAIWIKNLNAEANAIRAEEKTLAERRKTAERKAERLKNYISEFLSGEAFKTAKVAVSFRRSSAVELDDDFISWAEANAPDLLRYKEPEADKTAIKAAITDGLNVKHATITENVSVQIK